VRKLIILIVVVVFGLYCWQAGQRYTLIDLPHYQEIEVDLLDGKTLRAWDDPAYASAQAEHLSDLETHRYQPLAEGFSLSDGTIYTAGSTLHAKDYAKIIDDRRTSTVAPLKLRDPSALWAVDARHYSVRNPMAFTTVEGENVSLNGGEKLTKILIDKMLQSSTSIPSLGIIGHGDVVSPEAGTMAMVILIFLALVMGLKDVLWDPILAIVDERQKDLEEGTSLSRKNRDEQKKLDQERREKFAEARKEYMDKLNGVQREAMKEADEILAKARHDAHKIREESSKELEKELESAESSLQKQVDVLANEIVAQVIG